ncbi:unnamed protein product, partial [Brassica rapa]
MRTKKHDCTHGQPEICSQCTWSDCTHTILIVQYQSMLMSFVLHNIKTQSYPSLTASTTRR